MMANPIRNFLIVIFIFSVLEKTGCDLIAFFKWGASTEQFGGLTETEPEKSATESESKEKPLQEFFLCTFKDAVINSSHELRSKMNGSRISGPVHSFYPSVPTPPPNLG